MCLCWMFVMRVPVTTKAQPHQQKQWPCKHSEYAAPTRGSARATPSGFTNAPLPWMSLHEGCWTSPGMG